MSQPKENETDEYNRQRLLKLDRIEELATAVEVRWKRAGRLSRIEEDVRELLDEIRRSAEPVKRKKTASGRGDRSV